MFPTRLNMSKKKGLHFSICKGFSMSAAEVEPALKRDEEESRRDYCCKERLVMWCVMFQGC